MEKLILAFMFIVLPMILNAIEQKKKREAERRMRENPRPRPATGGGGGGEAKPRSLEEWIESMQRKADERAERPPTVEQPKPAPPAPPRPAPPPRAPEPVRPKEPAPEPRQRKEERERAERPQVRVTSARSRPSMTAAERAIARSAERARQADVDPIAVDSTPGTKDSARRAARARSATRESERSGSLRARRDGKGGSKIDIEGRSDLRRAFILKEVLGTPKGAEDLET